MTSQVRVRPSGHIFTIEEHETILEAALRQGVGLPYGCRDGACGACRGKVVAGRVDLGSYQGKALTAQERSEEYILFCCARACGDIDIEVREVTGIGDIPIKTLPCRVEKIEKIHDVAILKLKLPVSERLQFRAGQYIDILMKNGCKRSFSIANGPHDDAVLELHVRHQRGGSFSEYVFTQMKEREIMRFKGPLGTFFLREESTKPIIFVVSGTGFAPVKGMIEYAIHQGTPRRMVLYWGARTYADLYMGELARRWQAQLPNFTFIPVLSDALPDDALPEWRGRSGLVHQAVLDDFNDLSSYQVYACGAPAMVEAAQQSFIAQRNLPNDEFYADAFTVAKDSIAKLGRLP